MRFSVIIPNYNGSIFISYLCEALSAQKLSDKYYEIIFVDNGSTDNSLSTLKRSCKINRLKIKFLTYTEEQGSYAARNYGATCSRGELLVFTDVDCRPDPYWLYKINEEYKKRSGDFLLTGSVKLFPKDENFSRYEWFDYCSSLDQKKYSLQKTGATANLVVTRRAYDRVGGFLPLISGADRDFCRRLMKFEDIEFIYAPDASVMHPARSTPREIKKKLFRVAQGLVELNYNNQTLVYRLYYLFKNLLGLFLQLNQWRIIIQTFKLKHYSKIWALKFSFVVLRMGFFARISILHLYLNKILGKSSFRNEQFDSTPY